MPRDQSGKGAKIWRPALPSNPLPFQTRSAHTLAVLFCPLLCLPPSYLLAGSTILARVSGRTLGSVAARAPFMVDADCFIIAPRKEALP